MQTVSQMGLSGWKIVWQCGKYKWQEYMAAHGINQVSLRPYLQWFSYGKYQKISLLYGFEKTLTSSKPRSQLSSRTPESTGPLHPEDPETQHVCIRTYDQPSCIFISVNEIIIPQLSDQKPHSYPAILSPLNPPHPFRSPKSWRCHFLRMLIFVFHTHSSCFNVLLPRLPRRPPNCSTCTES